MTSKQTTAEIMSSIARVLGDSREWDEIEEVARLLGIEQEADVDAFALTVIELAEDGYLDSQAGRLIRPRLK